MSGIEVGMAGESKERAMTNDRQREQAGFALILAMLCLMVLTFLGMALATTTSTELQIATNYRWSQQAFYNAEAGVELGKRFVRQFDSMLDVVGLQRTVNEMTAPPSDWTLARPGPDGELSRNWENQACDTGGPGEYGGGVGFGNVFDHPSFAAPMQNSSVFFGQQLNGTFTLWIRRALEPDPASGDFQDSATRLVLTAEGTAPYLGAQQLPNRAVRFLTVEIERIEANQCGDYAGQGGSGATGSGYTCESGELGADGLAGWGSGTPTEPDSTVQ
jgi:hypothetical protein